jgi:YVTN family beta-propeller protein
VDLNSYYLLVLNQDASISVIDPVVSMTGNTSLFATVVLKRPGADWVKGADDKRLYVSMPRAGEVAVVDAETFKVVASVPAGGEPTRLALQPDRRRLWVGNDARDVAESGVTVIDAVTERQVGRVATGLGHHELAFSADGRRAFVTNRDAGTVSVIDTATLAKVKDLDLGGVPIALATSSLSQFVYVSEARGGRIVVVDPATLQVTTSIAARPGLGPTRFSQDGRWGLVVNPAEHAVHVVDASSNRLVHTVPVGAKPYQLGFTRAFAYVRLLDSEQVKMINLLSLGEGKTPIVQGFPAGTGAPMAAGELSLADAFSAASTEAAVFAVNPADGNTYFYMEGMNAPMGSFGGYGHRVQAVTVVDRSLKEISPGVYAGRLRLPVAGHYDVAFLLDNPRVLHCFGADALPSPALAHRAGLSVEFLDLPFTRPIGGAVPVRVKLTDGRSGEPRIGLGDVQLSWHLVPGRRPSHALAREVGGGVYEATLPLRKAGVYYVFASVASLKVTPNQVLFRTVEVQQDGPVAAEEGPHVRDEP